MLGCWATAKKYSYEVLLVKFISEASYNPYSPSCSLERSNVTRKTLQR